MCIYTSRLWFVSSFIYIIWKYVEVVPSTMILQSDVVTMATPCLTSSNCILHIYILAPSLYMYQFSFELHENCVLKQFHPQGIFKRVTRASTSTPDHAASLPTAKPTSWTEASFTQLIGSGTVSQTMLLERLPVQGSILLKGVYIGFFWQMVFHDFSGLPISY